MKVHIIHVALYYYWRSDQYHRCYSDFCLHLVYLLFFWDVLILSPRLSAIPYKYKFLHETDSTSSNVLRLGGRFRIYLCNESSLQTPTLTVNQICSCNKHSIITNSLSKVLLTTFKVLLRASYCSGRLIYEAHLALSSDSDMSDDSCVITSAKRLLY